jgi:polar amino acid transport system permease protein
LTFQEKLYQNLIQEDRWKYIATGLKNTLTITVCALLLGLALGFIIAFIRVTHDTADHSRPQNLWGWVRAGALNAANGLARLYLTVIRGTPVVTQLMIIYFVIFSGLPFISKLTVAIIAFGINSGAYIAEIFRGGIMSIDAGQMEAGRSLGLSYAQTMWRIIMPQAVKNVLPALGNESITLLKETAVAGIIAVHDLTRGGDIIRSRTYTAFIPLVTVALIYLVIVLFLQSGISRLERRLAQSDRR